MNNQNPLKLLISAFSILFLVFILSGCPDVSEDICENYQGVDLENGKSIFTTQCKGCHGEAPWKHPKGPDVGVDRIYLSAGVGLLNDLADCTFPMDPDTNPSPTCEEVKALFSDLSDQDLKDLAAWISSIDINCYTISGNIQTNDGNSTSGGVSFVADNGAGNISILTNEFGAYSITGLPAGIYQVSATVGEGYGISQPSKTIVLDSYQIMVDGKAPQVGNPPLDPEYSVTDLEVRNINFSARKLAN